MSFLLPPSSGKSYQRTLLNMAWPKQKILQCNLPVIETTGNANAMRCNCENKSKTYGIIMINL